MATTDDRDTADPTTMPQLSEDAIADLRHIAVECGWAEVRDMCNDHL